jgi:hypothetical protein
LLSSSSTYSGWVKCTRGSRRRFHGVKGRRRSYRLSRDGPLGGRACAGVLEMVKGSCRHRGPSNGRRSQPSSAIGLRQDLVHVGYCLIGGVVFPGPTKGYGYEGSASQQWSLPSCGSGATHHSHLQVRLIYILRETCQSPRAPPCILHSLRFLPTSFDYLDRPKSRTH